MKNLIPLTLMFLLTACSSHTLDFVLDDALKVDNDPSEFAAIKKMCISSLGTFDSESLTCHCPLSYPFYPVEGKGCLSTPLFENDEVKLSSPDNKYQLQIINEAKISKNELNYFINNVAISPISKSRIFIFKNSNEFKQKNSFDKKLFLNTSLLKNSTNQIETQIYFSPANLNNFEPIGIRLKKYLDVIFAQDLSNLKNRSILPIIGTSCSDGCFVSKLILDNKEYTFLRMQTFISGNMLFDTVRVINKFDNHLEAIIVLFNNKVSHYLKSSGSGYFSAYSSEGTLLSSMVTVSEK